MAPTAASPFFRAKFRTPVAPGHFVRRPRLVGILDDLASYPVTAVVALAGAGKTALAADWVRHGGRRAAWLSLDDGDRDPARFWTAVGTALEALAPGVPDRALALLRDAGPDAAVRALVDDLDAADSPPAVLVLDDLHRVDDDDGIGATLGFFAEHLPGWLHLLLLSRHRPPLPVDRLRAGGTFADLDFEALRFSDDEALALLSGRCPEASDVDLPAIAAWTDGWAAALQLAVLAVRSRRAGRLAGAGEGAGGGAGGTAARPDRLVDDYVWHEVLQAERPEVIELLLATSVVDRVSYGLAEALSGRPDAGDLLVQAESRGLFVTSLDAGGWFEVHALVREMLRAELERRWPDDLPERHARAARWFEDVGDERTAVEHWLRAGRPAEALRVLAATTVRLGDGGRGADPAAILARIPVDAAGADIATRVRYAWCQLLTDRRSLDDAVTAVEAAVPPVAESAVLRSVADLGWGDWRAAARSARAGLADPSLAGPVASTAWTVLAEEIALDERWSDRSAEVAEVRFALGHDASRRTAFEGTRAVGLALAGEPLEAVRVAAGVRRAAEEAEARGLGLEVSLAEALAARELGDPDRARAGLEALAAAATYPLTHVQVLAALELVGCRLDEGDPTGAAVAFAEAEELCRRELGGPGGASWLARAGVRLALARGDVAGAGRWAERIDDPFWAPCRAAEVDLAAGRPADALARLADAPVRSPRQLVQGGLARARALAGEDHDAALKAVSTAVELAAEHGMLRTVAAAGGPVVDLVELAAWRVPGAWLDRVRRALVPAAAGSGPAATLVEPLTDRERDVLRLLPSRLTLREIAAELFVSQNTLKFHLRVIYRKLGVNGRAEAVETARRLRLLARG
jgi:LuxR family maltose regulon positive regulatory protein